MQIRKRLVPVVKLKEITERIARQEFDSRITVQSDDEFAELAASVNSMAGQLGQQFHMLSTKSEIERAVLSLLNTEKIVETILIRLAALFHCPVSSLTLVREKNLQREFVLDHGVLRVEAGDANSILIRRVVEIKRPLLFNDAEISAAGFEFPQKSGIRSIMARPLMVKDDVLAVLVFYANKPLQFGPQELQLLGDLGSQATIAIHNSSRLTISNDPMKSWSTKEPSCGVLTKSCNSLLMSHRTICKNPCE
jgi:nitrate/nitrite-specific signal transduction histidine kinase